MNLANQLTLSRVALSFIFMAVLFSGFSFAMTAALAIFVLAALTDYWDGAVARKRSLQSDFGALMDPVADKILVSTAFISFVELPGTGVHAWMVVLIIAREFLITGLRLLAMGKGELIKAGIWGKHKTFSQMFAIILLLVFLSAAEFLRLDAGLWADWQTRYAALQQSVMFWVMLAVIGLTLLSGYVYAKGNRHIFWERPAA